VRDVKFLCLLSFPGRVFALVSKSDASATERLIAVTACFALSADIAGDLARSIGTGTGGICRVAIVGRLMTVGS